MNALEKLVRPREILKDISPELFPGAKIGVLGLEGSGKSLCCGIMRAFSIRIFRATPA